MVTEENPYAALAAELKAGFIGGRLVYHPSLPSTMDEARREIRRGAPGGTVVIAGEQTGGRGRRGRTWLTPAGNIALSICLYPDVASLPYLVMIAALAAARAIEAASGLEASLKWPNDVLIGGRKVGGILIENEVKAGRACSIVGIGINTALRAAEIDEIAAIATSLEGEGREVNRADLVRELLIEFERLYLMLPEGKTIYEAWRGRLATLGRNVDIISGDSIIRGVAESVAEDGALSVRQPDGSLTRIVAGDVSLRERP
jgi:BirA family biotin operon repressor/biotin-[acetyl-CoA-carboxylase] ligase